MKLPLFPLVQLPKKFKVLSGHSFSNGTGVSISSTSEEVQRGCIPGVSRRDFLFPLVQLPKKFKGSDATDALGEYVFPLVQLPKKFKAGDWENGMKNGREFPLVQLPKKFKG